MSPSRSLTKSQPRSLASNAMLNIARSRIDPTDLRCCRIAQMCFGLSGALAPVIRPAFQGLRGIRKRSGWLMATSHDRRPLVRIRSKRRRCASSGHWPDAGKQTSLAAHYREDQASSGRARDPYGRARSLIVETYPNVLQRTRPREGKRQGGLADRPSVGLSIWSGERTFHPISPQFRPPCR